MKEHERGPAIDALRAAIDRLMAGLELEPGTVSIDTKKLELDDDEDWVPDRKRK